MESNQRRRVRKHIPANFYGLYNILIRFEDKPSQLFKRVFIDNDKFENGIISIKNEDGSEVQEFNRKEIRGFNIDCKDCWR